MAANAPSAALEPATLARLGRYQVLRRLAVGGMAELFLAKAEGIEGFEKLVALKRMLPELSRDTNAVAMFLDEARLAAQLHHPNLVQVFDIGAEDGSYFIAMEFVHGQDLLSIQRAAHQAGRAIDDEVALTVLTGLCAGLHYAHEKDGPDGQPLGIVHRDVSPSNVLVSYDGAVKLADFGIAKATTRRTTKTQHGLVRGKVNHMSPEQCESQPLDRRCDVFALGILLYELTTGRKLFSGESDFATMRQVVDRPIPPPSLQRPGYSPELERIVLKALAREREDRHPTAQALQLELEAFARERRLETSPVRLERFVGQLFGHELEAWHQAQRTGKALADHVAEVLEPAADADELDTGAPPAIAPAAAVAASAEITGGTRKVRASQASFEPLPSRSSRWRWIALAGAAVLLVAAGGLTLRWRLRAVPEVPPPVVVIAPPPIVVAPPTTPTPVAALPTVEHDTPAEREVAPISSSRHAARGSGRGRATTAKLATAPASTKPFDIDAPLPPPAPRR